MIPVRTAILILTLVWGGPAVALELRGEAVQGGLVYGETVPGSRVTLDGTPVRLDPQGRFVVGFGREAPPEALLAVERPDGSRETRSLQVVQREYEVQRIDGLPQSKVTPPEAVWARIQADAAKVAAARAHDSDQPHFLGPFAWPTEGRVTGVYGSQRILNGTPRQPHYGIDIAAPEGTPVVAPAGGVVRLAEADLYYTGGTLILDHGYGVTSTFLHLARLEVAVGDLVQRGQRLGTVGSTGRSTGPHLDWRLNWYEARIDPQLVAEPLPAD